MSSALKPHRLLSRSCSGSVRVAEELDGLRHHHRLLSRSCSSNTRVGRGDPFGKDTAAAGDGGGGGGVGGRRLSLTSGLIGILAPSLATPPVVRPL